MSDMVIKISGAPADIEGLNNLLLDKSAHVPVSTKRLSTHRDFSVLEILVTAALSGAVKVVFDIVKGFISEKLGKAKNKKSTSSFAIQIGEKKIDIPANTPPERLQDILKSVFQVD